MYKPDQMSPTRAAVPNVVAAVGVALVSFAAAAVLAALVILAVAIDVAGFAGSQAIALGRLRAV